MDDFLYLDTARIGRPSLKTIQAGCDSLHMASEEGGSAYFDRFVQSGFDGCPSWMRSRYPGLLAWRGVGSLKRDLRSLVCGSPDLPVLLANRSAQLMSCAAWLMFPRCRNVLTCDLGWPAYHEAIIRHASQNAGRVTHLGLKDLAFSSRATADEIADTVVRHYRDQRCDGLFIPAVSNLGVRLPVEQIVTRIEASGTVRFVVVDGSQQFCHTATALAADYCDLYLTGCHKWLAGHHPMGVAFYGRRRSREYIDTMIDTLLGRGHLDDPLLRLTRHVDCGNPASDTETVNLAALFTSQAAATEASDSTKVVEYQKIRLDNQRLLKETLTNSGWRPIELNASLASGIVLAQAERSEVRQQSPVLVRGGFRERGVGLTSYNNGIVRFSLPTGSALQEQDFHRLECSLKAMR